MSEGLILSASSVEAYMSCGYGWYLQYIEQIAGEQSMEAAVGLSVHAGIEAYYKLRLRGATPQEAAASSEPEEARLVTWLFELPAILHSKDPLDKMEIVGGRVLAAYIEDVGAHVTPVLVEHPGIVTVNGIGYSYHVDLVDRGPKGRPRVRDTKVKGAKPSEVSRHLRQVVGYCLGVRVDMDEIEEDALIDVMVRLKRDRPYYMPFSYGGPISDRDIGVFAFNLVQVADGIEKKRFEPTGLEAGECKWCPVRESCEYLAEYTREMGDTK